MVVFGVLRDGFECLQFAVSCLAECLVQCLGDYRLYMGIRTQGDVVVTFAV